MLENALTGELPVRDGVQTCPVPTPPYPRGLIRFQHRIVAGDEHDCDGRGGGFGSLPRNDIRDDHGNLVADQLGHEARQAIQLIVCPAILDRHIQAVPRQNDVGPSSWGAMICKGSHAARD